MNFQTDLEKAKRNHQIKNKDTFNEFVYRQLLNLLNVDQSFDFLLFYFDSKKLNFDKKVVLKRFQELLYFLNLVYPKFENKKTFIKVYNNLKNLEFITNKKI